MSSRRSDIDELRAIAARAEAMAARLETRDPDLGALATDVMRDLVPEARLHAYRGKDGTWYAHLIMPREWEPKYHRGWMSPGNDDASYWTGVTGTTERDVLLKGLRLLLDPDHEQDCPCRGACHNEGTGAGRTPCSERCRFATVVHR